MMRSLDPVHSKHLRIHFEHSTDLYCELGGEGDAITLSYVNAAWTRVLGWTKKELEGSKVQDWLHEEDLKPTADIFDHAEPGPRPFRNRYRHKKGGYRTIEWTGHAEPMNRDSYAHGRDVTDRIVSDERGEHFTAIAEKLPLMLTEYLPSGQFIWVNQSFHDQLGYTVEEASEPGFLKAVMREAVSAEGARKFMLSGSTLWQEFKLTRRDGRELETIWTNIRLSNGNYIGIGQDVTDRRKSEEKLVQSSRMASLGEMSAGVSHEINNPLTVIQGSAYRVLRLLQEEKDRTGKTLVPEVETELQCIVQYSDRIARIVKGLRAFSRTAEHEPLSPQAVKAIVEDVMDLAGEKLRTSNVELSIDLQYAGLVNCRSVQMSQVLLNLLTNAYDAAVTKSSRTGETPKIWIQSIEFDHTIQLSVEDSGDGVPKSLQSRIMEPFFTTKDVGKGTGLGLSISKGLVESHGGRLFFDHTASRTRFVVELPKIIS